VVDTSKGYIVLPGKLIVLDWEATEEEWREAFAEVKKHRGLEEHERRKAEQRKSV